MRLILFAFGWVLCCSIHGQTKDSLLYQIIDDVSAERLQYDVEKLVGFGTRHTLSDTISDTRGIGAARRWVKAEFENISAVCHDCLDVFYQKNFYTTQDGPRIVKDVWINNVVAIQKGKTNPNHFILIGGHLDSRISSPTNYTDDAPGANDDATGVAARIEAARILSQYEFHNSIVYIAFSGEEQGLFGAKGMAQYAQENHWNIIGILNNDMIGNIQGVDGVIDNRTFRIFSEPIPPTLTQEQRQSLRFYGGDADGISRQLARYIHQNTVRYLPHLNPQMIFRLDRFGRGGDQRPFTDVGFAGIRIMEAHENYNRQHQDLRIENGITYGDVIEGVDFEYARNLTAVNCLNLASLAWAPLGVRDLNIGGIVEPSTKLKWTKVNDSNVSGYNIYWRETTSPQWEYSRYVGDVDQYTLQGVIIDNYLFGVSTVGKNGFESVVVYPQGVFR